MGQPDALAGNALVARAAEQLEHAFMVFGRDAASIVAHIDHDAPVTLLPALYGDRDGPVRVPVLYRIVEKIAQYLFERQLVGKHRRGVDRNARLALRLVDLVTDGGHGA